MTKDILLLFLSTVTIDRDTGAPRETDYSDVGLCHTTNESAVRYLCARGIIPEKIFAFASTTVQTKPVGGAIAATHEKYFCERVSDVVPDIAACYEAQPYDDRATVDESLGSVIAMAERINGYITGLPQGTQVTLHADFTGGLRHANTMMIALLRLLEYSGVNIGYILYSNYVAEPRRVERINSIYDMFGLVAGATEFVNYGSVKALEEYFPAGSRTAVLDRLLGAMHSFADEIKLCHAGRLIKATEELAAAQAAFTARDIAEEHTGERLMAQLESRIRRDYGALLAGGDTRLNLIEWCLDHDYFQQALTLYVESVPEIIMSSGIVTIAPAYRKRIEKLWGNSVTTLAFFFLTELTPEGVSTDLGRRYSDIQNAVTDANKRLLGCYKSLASKIKDGTTNALASWQELTAITQGEYSAPNTPERAESLLRKLFVWQENPRLLKSADIEKDCDYARFVNAMASNDPLFKVEKFASLYGMKKLERFLDFMLNNMGKETMAYLFTDVRLKYSTRVRLLVEAGVAENHVHPSLLRYMLDAYGYFKNERNSSNHARQDADVITASELQDRMRAALKTIREAMPPSAPVVE